jgi:hypothetical protein
LCSKERRKFLKKKDKNHEIWTIIHDESRSRTTYWSSYGRRIIQNDFLF